MVSSTLRGWSRISRVIYVFVDDDFSMLNFWSLDLFVLECFKSIGC